MTKRIIGIILLAVMVGFTVTGFIDKQKEESGSVSKEDNELKGAGIVAPGQTGVKQGEMAPDFKLKTLSGETFQLSDLRGKKVILNFWASWCKPCKQEMPEMQEFYNKHGDEVEIIAVNLTGSEMGIKNVREYVDKHGYTYPVVLDKELKVQKKYGVTVIPTTYFIGTDGKIQLPKKAGPMTYEYMENILKKLN